MDAVIYTLDYTTRKVHHTIIKYNGVRIDQRINEIFNKLNTNEIEFQYVLIENFKSKHSFHFKDFDSQISYSEFGFNELYDNVALYSETTEPICFLNDCFSIQLPFEEAEEHLKHLRTKYISNNNLFN